MNQIIRAEDIGGLIFQPAESLNRRVIEAETEVSALRKQRSRALTMAVVAGVAFLTCALGAAFVLLDANGRVKDEVEKREKAEDQLKEIEMLTEAQVKEAKNEASVARRQLTGVYEYVDISSARITSLQHKDDLDNYRAFFNGKQTSGLDLSKSLNVQLPAWNITGITRENWTAKVRDAYLADAAVYSGAVQVIEDWMVRTAQPSRPQKTCVTPNPYQPSPRDCEDPNR